MSIDQIIYNLNEKATVLEVVRSVRGLKKNFKDELFSQVIDGRFSDNAAVGLSRVKMVGYTEKYIRY